jgi:glycosyltransferase involved in cell wall biosynthesis
MKKKILFISNHASFFVSHRINLYEEALKRFYEFYLIFGSGASKVMEKNALIYIKKKKIKFSRLTFSNNNFSINDFVSLLSVIFFIRKFNPNIVHSASPKANIYAGISAFLFKKILLVISFSGMGYLFTQKKLDIITIFKKILFKFLLKFIFLKKKKKIIVQNKHDYKFLINNFNLKVKDIILIKGGSGIYLEKYKKIKKKKSKNIIMVSRILKNKGIIEFCKAAELLKKKYPEWKFILIGTKDYLSPDTIDDQIINYYVKNKIIKLLGYKKNIINILSSSEIFCLPSYREGMPKATLEALAAGVPVVTSDAVGCRESIINNYNGYICKTGSYLSLANKIEKLILDPKKRKIFSKNAINFARRNFSIKDITNKIYNIYEKN